MTVSTWNNDQRLKKRREGVGHPNINVFIFLADLHRLLAISLLREIEHITPCVLLTVETNGQFTHLVELNPLLVFLGAGVGDPQSSKLGPKQVGGVLLHG